MIEMKLQTLLKTEKPFNVNHYAHKRKQRTLFTYNLLYKKSLLLEYVRGNFKLDCQRTKKLQPFPKHIFTYTHTQSA